MSGIELYSNKQEAINARDYYNHNLNRRAVVAQVPNDPVRDFGGGPKGRVFQESISPTLWVLVVEDPIE